MGQNTTGYLHGHRDVNLECCRVEEKETTHLMFVDARFCNHHNCHRRRRLTMIATFRVCMIIPVGPSNYRNTRDVRPPVNDTAADIIS
jgi:hypothetical protein